eukprot:7146878-Ditylum_brightwellii.AAC.1
MPSEIGTGPTVYSNSMYGSPDFTRVICFIHCSLYSVWTSVTRSEWKTTDFPENGDNIVGSSFGSFGRK